MIEVQRLSDDRLSGQFWRFHIRADHSGSKITLTLTGYQIGTRLTPRHKFKIERLGRWSLNEPRAYWSGIKPANVPLPEDVCAEAIATASNSITIKGAVS